MLCDWQIQICLLLQNKADDNYGTAQYNETAHFFIHGRHGFQNLEPFRRRGRLEPGAKCTTSPHSRHTSRMLSALTTSSAGGTKGGTKNTTA